MTGNTTHETAHGHTRFRVVELGSWLAAPGAAALLADMGAEVIKIEAPSGDPGRHFIQAMGSSADTTPSFSLLNRGKSSVVIDFRSQKGREELAALIASADVFVTNLRAGSLKRAALDPETLLALHPKLIFASITGLGLRGPDAEAAVYDLGGFWARSGLMWQLAAPEAGPPSPTGGFGDIVTSLSAYAAIVTALLLRERTGIGGLVETSLLQSGAFVASGDLAVEAAHGRVAPPRPREDGRTPLVNSYRCKDGRWFYLTCVEAARHFPNVCTAIERKDLISDPRFCTAQDIRRNGRDLVRLLDEAFGQKPLEDWAHRFAAEDVWWQPIASPKDVLNDPQLRENDMLRPVWSGDSIYPMVTSPFTILRQPPPEMRAPALGEQTNSAHWCGPSPTSDKLI